MKKQDSAPQRTPPQNIEAEQEVLGTILLHDKALLKVAELLQPDDFYLDQHKVIYGAAVALSERQAAQWPDRHSQAEVCRRTYRF